MPNFTLKIRINKMGICIISLVAKERERAQLSHPGEIDFMQTPNKSGLVVVSLAILVTVMIAPQLIPLFTVTPVSDDTLSTTSEPIPPGMLAYWELNEGDGTTVHDIVPPLVHGTTARSPAWVPGIAQSGLELLSDQYINFNSPTELYAVEYITIEAWVNLPDTTGLHTILMNSYISTYIMYHFGIQDGALYFDRQSGAPGNQFTSTATINADFQKIYLLFNN